MIIYSIAMTATEPKSQFKLTTKHPHNPPPPPPHTSSSRATYGVSLCDFQQNLGRYHGKALYSGYIKMSPMNSYQ